MSSPIYELLPEKNLIIEYNIQNKTFDQFRYKFETNKWLNLVEWYEISHKIDKESQKRVPGNGRFEVGNNLDVHYDFLDVKECPVKLEDTFQKNFKFVRIIVQEKIVKKAEKLPAKSNKFKEEYKPPEAKSDETSETKSTPTSVLEYVPKDISSNESDGSKTYVPSKKQNDNVEEYSPMDLNNSNNSEPVISYTPSRIKATISEDIVENSDEDQENKKSVLRKHRKVTKTDEDKRSLSKQLFGDVTDDEENRAKSEIISISSQTDDGHSSKRLKLDRENKSSSNSKFSFLKYGKESDKDRDKERDKHRKESSKSKDHKRKAKDKDKRSSSKSSSNKNSPSVSKWLTCERGLTSNSSSNDSTKTKSSKKTSSTIQKNQENKKPEKSKLVDAEEEAKVEVMMAQYNDLKTTMEKLGREQEMRKAHLKDLKIYSCEDFSNERISEHIALMKDMIKPKIAQYKKTGRIQSNQDFDPVDISHSSILSEQQLLFVMAEIEKQFMEIEDRGMFLDLLTDDIVPEVLINMVMSEFDIKSREACLQQIKDQDERRLLFDESK